MIYKKKEPSRGDRRALGFWLIGSLGVEAVIAWIAATECERTGGIKEGDLRSIKSLNWIFCNIFL